MLHVCVNSRAADAIIIVTHAIVFCEKKIRRAYFISLILRRKTRPSCRLSIQETCHVVLAYVNISCSISFYFNNDHACTSRRDNMQSAYLSRDEDGARNTCREFLRDQKIYIFFNRSSQCSRILTRVNTVEDSRGRSETPMK